ncbi:hypothetical protein TREMEDRAFT_56429 [Tremella mesenterica DSM 1558]|uniref:uncharacterized protein n=1 Tax=Tremella mesenterica (strain ATCC 24925 / CBS 8224 / DSM 1558 / NBRC 9311 / NRRL Y-6157 / RJB 2259-6 / UBC 559-6) TaxID=578456 RepID=UPI0003F4A44E|nr:uncharacterized protein TREMEDRAFT_56429 [Tremella mesenterica DSM 1558]EIW71397.1 hypothetical protein TREMEDRAFT_56429 [Tremella mesenterica DSM 1558]
MSSFPVYRTVNLENGIIVSYVEAGSTSNPTLLLAHGFPSHSSQFRNLIPLLSDKYHILAPDFPFFGHTIVPSGIPATFETLTKTLGSFLDALSITSFAVYIFDYGAPSSLRLALERPDAIKALITQNGNAYLEGLGSFWDPLRTLWSTEEGTEEFQIAAKALDGVFTLETSKWQVTAGVSSDRLERLNPDFWTLDTLLNLATPEQKKNQLSLFYDYRKNLDLYPQFQKWLGESKVPVLVAWGGADPIFPKEGGEAYIRDSPNAKINIIEGGGHFLLETHLEEVATLIKDFLKDVKF